MKLAIRDKIHEVNGQKVILEEDLALLYGISTKLFHQAVKRHMEGLREDGVFFLTADEYYSIKPAGQTTRGEWRQGSRYYAYTKQGVMKLVTILKSEKLISMDPDFAIQYFRVLYHMHSEYPVWSASS